MIKLIDNSVNFSSHYTYCDHFPGQARNLILLMHHYSEDPYVEEILEKVFNEIIKLDLDSIDESEIKGQIKNFFVEINWRLYSLFGQRPDLERGLSLVLGIIQGNRLYCVQFGRYFLALLTPKTEEEIGKKWEDLKVKSYSTIGLLGSQDININVQIEEVELKENSYFVVIESSAGLELKKLGLHYLSITERLNQLKEKGKFGYILINNQNQKARSANPWIKRRRVNRTATILLILIILSAAYVYYGKNLIDDVFSRLRLTRTEFTRNELKKQFFTLQEQAQELLNEISRDEMNIEIIPMHKIAMKADWELKISEKIQQEPCFDYRQIYLISEHYVYSIDKNQARINWEKRFNEKVEVLRLVDANRVLVSLSDDKLYCLSRDDGDVIWQRNYELPKTSESSNSLSQISLDQFRQFEDSVFLMYEGRKLSLALVRTGEVVSEYLNNDEIGNISDYDMLERCLYITSGKKIKRIDIKIM